MTPGLPAPSSRSDADSLSVLLPCPLLPAAMTNSMIIVGALNEPGTCDFNLALVLISVGTVCIAVDIYRGFLQLFVPAGAVAGASRVHILCLKAAKYGLEGFQVCGLLIGALYILPKIAFVDLSDEAIRSQSPNFCEYSLFLTSCAFFGVGVAMGLTAIAMHAFIAIVVKAGTTKI